MNEFLELTDEIPMQIYILNLIIQFSKKVNKNTIPGFIIINIIIKSFPYF